MDAQEYQRLAARTLIETPDLDLSPEQLLIVGNVIGLAGETGEVVDLIKKGIFHQHGIDKAKLRDELGDVLWYVAALCTRLDIDMNEIMQENIDKLRKRYPEGYSSEKSINRLEH